MEKTFYTVIGVLGSGLAALFGGWDTAIIALVVAMAVGA